MSTESIVAAAVELIQDRGYARFSVNELARGMGVTPRAVRHRVGSRDRLVAAAADAVVGGIDVPSPGGFDWDDWLRLVATSVRGRLVDQPALIPLVLEQWASTSRGAQLVAATLEVLMDAAGNDLAAAVTAHNAFWAFVAGAVYAHSAPPTGAVQPVPGPGDVTESLEVLRARYAGAYPGANAVDVAFTAALDVMLLGIHAAIDGSRAHLVERRS